MESKSATPTERLEALRAAVDEGAESMPPDQLVNMVRDLTRKKKSGYATRMTGIQNRTDVNGGEGCILYSE